MKITNYAVLLLGLSTLSACGGGGGGTSFSSLSQTGTDMIVKYYNAPATSVSNMPTGSAKYQGVAAFNSSPIIDSTFIATADPLAKLTLTADFNSDSISGAVTGIKTYDGSPASGTVNIRGGTISGNTFLATADGVIYLEGVAAPVNALVDGVFVGTNAEGVFGTSAGTFGGQTFYGAYIAEK